MPLNRLAAVVVVLLLAVIAFVAMNDIHRGWAREQGRGEVLDSED